MRVEPSKAYRLLSPRIVVLLTTTNSKHGMNVIPVDFIVPVSYSPPIIMVSLQPSGHTYRNVKDSREFVVNVMDKKYSDEVMKCAARYQDGVNKIQQVGLHHFSSQLVRPPKIKEAGAWLECRFVDERVFKDHIAVFAEVVAAEASDEMVGEGEVDHSRISPVLHIAKDYVLELKIAKRRR